MTGAEFQDNPRLPWLTNITPNTAHRPLITGSRFTYIYIYKTYYMWRSDDRPSKTLSPSLRYYYIPLGVAGITSYVSLHMSQRRLPLSVDFDHLMLCGTPNRWPSNCRSQSVLSRLSNTDGGCLGGWWQCVHSCIDHASKGVGVTS